VPDILRRMPRVLIGYDGSEPARAAIAAAAALFGGAETVVANVHPEPLHPEDGAIARIALPSDVIRSGIEELARQTVAQARETAEEGAALANEAGLKATAATLTGNRPWRVLLDTAADSADLLVSGTRGRGPIERAVLGSTASSLVHHARVPLLIVPGETPLDGPALLGWDDSDGARSALGFAAAHLADRPLIVAHAWRSPVRHTVRGTALLHSSVKLFEDYAEGLDDIFRGVAEDAAQRGADAAGELGLRAHARVCESAAGDWHALLGAAKQADAAVVLVGSRGRGAVSATVLGSVTSGLAHAGELPVLIVPG
jgi:nucleotide-binding universal stress UspA family protein